MSIDQKKLTRRYLIWAYKSTRESFERIERKTTQLAVDEFILKKLIKIPKPKGTQGVGYQKLVDEFVQYIATKRTDEQKQKFVSHKRDSLNPQYLFLKNRLAIIKDAIRFFLSPTELKKIESIFEDEFTYRIWQAREH